MSNELLFLGTGASDWLIERRKKGMFFRHYCAALLNGEILFDCGPHVLDFASCYEENSILDGVKTIVITHRHLDHVDPNTVMKIAQKNGVNLICDDYTFSLMKDKTGITRIEVPLFKKTVIGDYQIIALPANHDVRGGGKDARHYIVITPDGKELFYGLDGTWFNTSEWQVLKKHKIDLMVFDCTIGHTKDSRVFEHNNFSMVKMMAKRVKKEEVLKKDGKIVCSHFSRRLMPSHFNTKLMLLCNGMIAAEDGMKIEF